MTAHRVVAAGKGHLIARPQRLDQRHRLLEAIDPGPTRVETDSRFLVFALHVAGADPQLKPALSEEIDGRGLPGEHDRMTKIVVHDEGPDSERACRIRRRHETDQRWEHLRQVIRHEERRVPEILGLFRLVPPSAACRSYAHTDAEAKRLHGEARALGLAGLFSSYTPIRQTSRNPSRS